MGIGDFFNRIPVIGHAKGLVHYLDGDTEAGDRAMNQATRTTAVAGAGVGGFFVAGPFGAAAAGASTGAAYDAAHSLQAKEPQGMYKHIDEFNKDPNLKNLAKTAINPVVDGATGGAAGCIAFSQSTQNAIQHVQELQQQHATTISNVMTAGKGTFTVASVGMGIKEIRDKNDKNKKEK